MAALNHVAQVRDERQQLAEAIRGGEMSADALDRETAGDTLRSIKVRSMVALAVGEPPAKQFFAPSGINDNIRVVGLTGEQRAAILAAGGQA